MSKLWIVIASSILLSSCGGQYTKCQPKDLVIGTPSEEIAKLCGKPSRIRSSMNGNGRVDEQWIYTNFTGVGQTYLYMDGGKFSYAHWSTR